MTFTSLAQHAMILLVSIEYTQGNFQGNISNGFISLQQVALNHSL